MLISPPFLPPRAANQTDDAAYVDAAMPGGEPGDGGFPISFDMNWHGGLHLQAPSSAQGVEPVRAIADGTVIYVRKPREPNDDENDPLNYGGGWSSDGCVILRHETEIGEGDNARVTFYSIYLHLNAIAERVKNNQRKMLAAGDRIWRKEEIGTAGWIYGQPNRIHFEIIADDANLARLVGRSSGDLSLTANGRTDSCWGDMYFYLPSGRPFIAQRPANASTPSNDPEFVRQLQQHPPPYTSTEPLFVQMHFERGDCVMTTYRVDGMMVGTPLRSQGYEYDLYRTASTIYPNNPSAGYELLRFGRVLGLPNELNPPNAGHWREVAHPQGTGCVDLNAAGVIKFSDADFPHWMNWKLVVDDDGDSHCDSRDVIDLLDTNHDGRVTPTEAFGQLSFPRIRAKADRMICKFPSEWEKGTIRKRWEWLMRHPDPTVRMEDTPEQFGRFVTHNEALCFWEDAGLDIGSMHWHFQPREFIKQFRKCGWLSKNEVVRLTRKTIVERNHEVGRLSNDEVLRYLNEANTRRPASLHTPLQKVMRKYGISTPARIAHLFSQLAAETGRLNFMVEGGQDSYFDKYEPGTDQGRKLGNTQKGDGKRFKGRGIIQITGRDNYTNYGRYKGQQSLFLDDASAALLETDANLTCDASGYYWVSKQRYTMNSQHKLIPLGEMSINSWADQGYDIECARQVTRCINPGLMHFDEIRWPCFAHGWYAVNDNAAPPDHFKPID
jgi:hydroxyethylthiazole kinase